ncbi:hypothetical protein CLBKND_04882 [Methylorubrum aminovorans]
MWDKPIKGWAQDSDDSTDRQEEQRVFDEHSTTDLSQKGAGQNTEDGDEYSPIENHSASSGSDLLVEDAVRELERIGSDLSLAEEERQERLSVFLARVYMASMAGKRDNERHKSLLLKTGVKVQKNTPHHKQTLRAVLSLASVKLVKQTEHECFLVLDGLDVSDVSETEAAVAKFLSENVEISGKHVTGFARAKAARAASMRLKEERDDRRMRENAEKDETLQAIVARGEQTRLGLIEVADDDAELEADVWLSVNRGHHVLMALKVAPEQLRSIILKFDARD